MAANSQINGDAFSDERFMKIANRAVINAIEKHRRLGESIVVMRDGQITWLAPEEIPPLETKSKPENSHQIQNGK